jgi:hypothetical protein
MNTKTFMITGLLFFSIGSAFSQAFDESRDQIRIEAGYAFTGSGDLEGFCFYNEYSRSVGNRFRIAPAIGFLDFFRNDTEIQFLEDARCISLDLTGYFCPVKTEYFDIEAGLGLYIRRWHRIYATGDLGGYSSPDLQLDSNSHDDYFKTAPGYTISIGTIMKISNRMGISIRGVYQNDINGDNSVTARVGVSIGL